MTVTAYLVRIRNVEVIDGFLVYNEEITHEPIFNLNYNSSVTDIFRNYGEYVDDNQGSGALLYLTKEGLEAYIQDNGFELLSDNDIPIVKRIQKEIDLSPMDIICLDCY